MTEDFYIGDWRVEPRRLTLSKEGTSVTVKPRSMAVLVELNRAQGAVVARRDLISRVWGQAAVSDDVVTQSIAELRRAMADDARSPRYIETVKRVGVRLIPQTARSPVPWRWRKSAWPWAGAAVLAACVAVPGMLWLSSPPPLPADRSIAVLPFTNMTPDPSNQYFGDGLAEEITSSLARIEGLRVVARTSAFALRDRDANIREIGNRLNVAHILESSVRRSGNHIRITAQLIDVDDGYHRFSRNYDYELGDIFEVQDAIASDLAAALALDLGVGVPVTTTSGIAYDLFLAGKQHMRNGRHDRARQLFQQAVLEDPEYALAYANLAISLTAFHENVTAVRQSGSDSGTWLEAADEAIRQAIRLQPRHEDVHIARASVAAARHDFGAEAGALAQAIALNPTSVNARIRLSRNLAARGQYTAAREELEAVTSLGPLNPELAARHAALLALFDGYDAGAERLLRLVEMGAESPLLWDALTELAADFGRYVDRVHYARQLVRSSPNSAWARAQLGDAYMELGELELADDWIRAAEEISRLEALKARARWLGATRDFASFDKLTAAAMEEYGVDDVSTSMSPAQSAITALRGLSLGHSGRHEQSARMLQSVLDSSPTLPYRSPHLPIYGRLVVLHQISNSRNKKGLESELADLHRSIDELEAQGIVELPGIPLLRAVAFALAENDPAAKRTFRMAAEQGWRAWTLERMGIAAVLADQSETVRIIDEDLARMRDEVERRGMAQTVAAMENVQ